MKYGVISDIHGNADALKAVLSHLKTQQVDKIICLGDVFYGPIDPKLVYELLRDLDIVYIRGNMDQTLLSEDTKKLPTGKYILDSLPKEALEWIGEWKENLVLDEMVYLCHGSPKSIKTYLLEEINGEHLVLKRLNKIEEELEDVKEPIILCGHTHLPRVVQISTGQVIINPGSVGMPCFESATKDGDPYASENGSYFAKYAVIEHECGNIQSIIHHTVPYEKQRAVVQSINNERLDYSAWVDTGYRR